MSNPIQLYSFHLMPWPHIDPQVREKYGSSWVVYPNSEYDPNLGHQLYGEYLDELVFADQIGFDAICVNEHHQNAYGLMPSPNLMAAALISRTKSARIAILGNGIALRHNPIRVAEEIAMLDVLAGGRRITLGFGRGAGRVEFNGLQVPMSESRDRFLESLEIVRTALSNQEFSFEGRFHTIPSMSIRPQPRSTDLAERMYCAWGSPETIPIAANAGLGPLFIPQKSWAEIGEEVVAFNDIRAEQGWAPQPPIVVCWVYCSPNGEEAWETARQYMTNYNDSALRHYEFHDAEHFRQAGGYDFYAKMADARKRVGEEKVVEIFARHQVWGTPEQCIEKLREIRATTNAAEFVGVFTYGDLPVEMAESSMRLFAAEVLPVLHADENEPASVAD